MTGPRGFVTIVYAVILCALGALLWLAWHARGRDYGDQSRKFDAALTDLLAAHGVRTVDIVSRVQEEKRSGRSRWISYATEVRLPPATHESRLTPAIIALGARHGLHADRSGDGDQRVLALSVRGVVLSQVTLIAGPPPPPAAPPKRFALVIDDIGYTGDLSQFYDLNIPITFAVLPRERYSRAIAEELSSRHMPFILHLPMEPEGYPRVDPGKAALLVRMNDAEIVRMYRADLATVPGAVGVSNHMGSRFTADGVKMRALLEAMLDQKLLFFDSVTSPRSKAAVIARRLGIPTAANDLFLDEKDEAAYMRGQFEIVLKRFRRTDRFIAIAHIQKKNLIPVLREYLPRFREQGIQFVYLTELVR